MQGEPVDKDSIAVTEEMILAGNAELERQGVALDPDSPPIFLWNVYEAMATKAPRSALPELGRSLTSEERRDVTLFSVREAAKDAAPSEGPTPRTDKACRTMYHKGKYGYGQHGQEAVPAYIARELERELAEALEDAEHWRATAAIEAGVRSGCGKFSLRHNDDGTVMVIEDGLDIALAYGVDTARRVVRALDTTPLSAIGRINPERVAAALKIKKHEWENADPELLEPWYSHWVHELTEQGLHDKADIATVLAILSQHAEDNAHDATRLHKDKMGWVQANLPGGWIDDLRKKASVPSTSGAWIPCSERLPNTNGDYLCRVGANHHPIRVLEFSPSEIQPGKPWRNGEDARPYAHFITHWMPLPVVPSATQERKT